MLLTEAKRWENILYKYFRENHPELNDDLSLYKWWLES